MAPLAVVEDLEVVEDRVGQLDARLPPLSVHKFGLHSSPEGFDHRVVVVVADRAHRRHDTGTLGAVGEGPGGELHAAIAVNNDAGLRIAISDRHRQRVGDQGRGLAGVDRPPDDSPGERIEDHRAVHLAFVGAVFGDVGDPSGFGASLVNIRSTRSVAVGVSCRHRGRRLPGRPLMPARAISSST